MLRKCLYIKKRGKQMTKIVKISILSLLIISFPASAKYRWDIEKAERSCELQQNSILRDRNGTPACDRLRELNRLQRNFEIGQRESNYRAEWREERDIRAREYENRNPRAIRNGYGDGYRWNPHESKYCQHDYDGYPTTCY